MTRYLQGLASRISGRPQERPLVPFIRRNSEPVVDPFQETTPSQPFLDAAPAGYPEPSLGGLTPGQLRSSGELGAEPPDPAGPLPPTAPQSTLPIVQIRPVVRRPVLLAPHQPSQATAFLEGHAPPTMDWPLAESPESPRAVAPAVPAARGTGALAASDGLEEALEKVNTRIVRRPDLSPGRGPEAQRLEPPPLQRPGQATERERRSGPAVPDLRPPAPSTVAPSPRAKEKPRLVIGRINVEVVPMPPVMPEPEPARPVQSRSAMPNRAAASRSKLRFGLGQM